jgi:outer membrane protein OmpA-like peptidoglycan-associated protein/tetratricopeptide (TPR) repeat protein
MRVSILLFLSCFFLNAIAQTTTVTPIDIEIQKADVLFMNKKYNSAATSYKKIYTKVKDEEQQATINFKIAESYRLSNNFKLAFEWYEKLINTKYPDPKILYSYGLLLKNYERYGDAARQFNDYLFEMPNDAEAKREVEACKIAGDWKLNPLKFSVENVKSLNTVYSDYAPFLSDGKIYWSSSRTEATGNIIFEWTGQKCADIFQSNINENSFGTVTKPNGLINSNYNEGVAWVDSTNTIMYFTQCNGLDGKGMNCKIYVSYKQNNQWSSAQVLPFCSDSFSVGHPAFTADMKRLYFASNMPGSIGEKDIYYINHNPLTGKWGIPLNLGPNVNSTEDEMFPAIHPDGKIYFASKGHFGMGGLDLFYTIDSIGGFTKAINLKSPINSGADDFGINFWGNQTEPQKPFAYFTSNREGGLGDDDIYSLSVKPFVFLVKGKVINQEDNTPLANAEVSAVTTNMPIKLVKTDGNGNFVSELALNQNIELSAAKEKFFKSTPLTVSSQNIKADTTIELTLYLNPIPDQGVEFTLQGIYYDLDKSDIRPEAARVLDSLVFILKNNPTITIELASHTDSRADEGYNLKLSQRRAQSCVDYLLKKGIAKPRLTAVGYGESKLINECADGVECNEGQHQENRRTTFRVLSTDYKGR